MAYYQIGGFHSHTHAWFGYDSNALATAVFHHRAPFYHHSVVEPIHGVRRSGATCLLMDDAQMRTWAAVLSLKPLGRPFAAHDFESLSPITFPERGHLVTTLAYLKPKPKSGKTRSYDTSQANRDFELAGKDSGVVRGRFEHGRVFYRILTDQELDAHKFGIRDVAWKDVLVMFSFHFNPIPRTLDGRPGQQQIEDPRMLDVSWTQVALPTLQTMADTTTRLSLKSARMVSSQGKSRRGGTSRTEALDADTVAARVQTTLLDHHEPVVLLVWDWNRTSYALQKLGIDCSRWQVGLAPLMGISAPQSPFHHPDRPRYNGASTSRRRSMSPRDDPSRRHSASVRARSPVRPQPRHRASIHIVDVQEMFETLVPSLGNERSINDAVVSLGLASTSSPADEQSRQMFTIWLSMVSGAAIDEQKRARAGAPMPVLVPSAPAPLYQPDEGYNEDEDPNDFEPITTIQHQAVHGRSMYDDDDDDDDE